MNKNRMKTMSGECDVCGQMGCVESRHCPFMTNESDCSGAAFADVEGLAAAIADDLFTNGNGETATTLNLMNDGRDLGGWSNFAVRSRIKQHLTSELAAKDAGPSDQGIVETRHCNNCGQLAYHSEDGKVLFDAKDNPAVLARSGDAIDLAAAAAFKLRGAVIEERTRVVDDADAVQWNALEGFIELAKRVTDCLEKHKAGSKAVADKTPPENQDG